MYYLYVLASRHHKHLSIGVTGDLAGGISARRTLTNRKLKRKRVMQKLVYVEALHSIDDAVEREIRLKKANRRHIDELVESVNPSWDSISVSGLVRAGFD
jgi:putative endonuclease